MCPSTPVHDGILHVRHAVVHAVAWCVHSCVGHADPMCGKTALWQLVCRLKAAARMKHNPFLVGRGPDTEILGEMCIRGVYLEE